MINIDKRALREEFQYMQENYSDPADRERQVIYIAAEALLDELEAAEKRIAELEARTPYGYLRQCDGQIQISIGREQPHNRSGGYATPWFAIYTAAAGKGEAS